MKKRFGFLLVLGVFLSQTKVNAAPAPFGVPSGVDVGVEMHLLGAPSAVPMEAALILNGVQVGSFRSVNKDRLTQKVLLWIPKKNLNPGTETVLTLKVRSSVPKIEIDENGDALVPESNEDYQGTAVIRIPASPGDQVELNAGEIVMRQITGLGKIRPVPPIILK
jgi:hypothetical protein